jgi:folate-dependent phosphoribosylglycinamide formyltransferase PurN
MKVLDNWGVLVSQTGSEVVAISEKLGILPSLLVTNRVTKISEKNMKIFGKNNIKIVVLPNKPTLDQYLRSGLLEKELITLHGFLRIVPAGFFPYFKGEIYNGHPGLITLYPELKGFNKQEDIAGNQKNYPYCGSVVHKVIPELDSGEVVAAEMVVNSAKTIDEAYALLRETSLSSWETFFKIWLSENKSVFLIK